MGDDTIFACVWNIKRRGVEGRVGELIGLEGGRYICVRNEVG